MFALTKRPRFYWLKRALTNPSTFALVDIMVQCVLQWLLKVELGHRLHGWWPFAFKGQQQARFKPRAEGEETVSNTEGKESNTRTHCREQTAVQRSTAERQAGTASHQSFG
jgi:hypothetical protein